MHVVVDQAAVKNPPTFQAGELFSFSFRHMRRWLCKAYANKSIQPVEGRITGALARLESRASRRTADRKVIYGWKPLV
jgi:hypothetical protein